MDAPIWKWKIWLQDIHIPNYSWYHKQQLIKDVSAGDSIVCLSNFPSLLYQNDLICKCWGSPASPLLEELIKSVRAIGAIFCRSAVLEFPAMFNHQSAQPTIFPFAERLQLETKRAGLRSTTYSVLSPRCGIEWIDRVRTVPNSLYLGFNENVTTERGSASNFPHCLLAF